MKDFRQLFQLKYLNIIYSLKDKQNLTRTPEARNVVDTVVYEKLTYFLEEHKETADNLVKKMIKAAQVRDAARKAREAARKGKGPRQEKNFKWKISTRSI